jgi:hypothetical protein
LRAGCFITLANYPVRIADARETPVGWGRRQKVGVKRKVFDEAQRAGKNLPSLHSAFWAPDPEPTIQTGITAMTAAVLELVVKK